MDIFLSWVEQFNPLLNWATVILIAFYVYYTSRTFREIKRQTDLQYEAFLVVASLKEDEISGIDEINQKAKTLHEKWRVILQDHIPDAIQDERYLLLELENIGRSGIIKWEIDINVKILPGDYLANKYNTGGEEDSWIIKYSGYKDNINPNNRIKVPIAILGAFYSAEFEWKIKYTDTRDEEYERFSGDNNYKDTNLFVSPKK